MSPVRPLRSRRPAVLAIAASALLAACSTPQVPGSSLDSAPGGAGLTASLSTDRTTYASGDTARATLTLRNNAADSVTVPFTSGQRYDFTLVTATGDTVWTWSADRSFIQALGEERIGPRQELRFEEPIPLPSAAGTYRLSATVTSQEAPVALPVVLTVGGR